ncbi:hypothetical protein [Streptomyces spiramyceticus]|uniref:hypothetical protein n=1 Tax=Streptomyces spiramyceticus TaxID=299717 RepID=UPI00237AEB63|nr:hypothetical protein [Streptomyces spiramyceticus]
MNSTTSTPGSVAATTALLQAELPRLEEQQQSLESELAAVTERLESVRSALSALQALSLAPEVQEPAPQPEPEARPAPSASTEAELVTGPKASSGAKRKSAEAPVKQKRRPAKKAAPAKSVKAKPAKKTAPPAMPAQVGESLTEQIAAFLAKSGKSPVRARDVAEALGRDETANSINAVRSTLDRLVATSRAHRAGRGLYQAPAN